MKEYDKTAAATLGTLPEGIGIKVGEPAPKVSGTTLAGKPQALAALYEEHPTLLVFYRGGWCPFCNFQIRDLVKQRADFEKRNVVPVLVSVDTPSKEEQTRVAHDVPYPLLSDSDLSMHKAFNVLEKLETEYVDRLKSKGKDLQAYSGQQHNTVAVPAMFLVSTEGKVLFAHADKDYKVRPRMSDVFAKLDEALARGK